VRDDEPPDFIFFFEENDDADSRFFGKKCLHKEHSHREEAKNTARARATLSLPRFTNNCSSSSSEEEVWRRRFSLFSIGISIIYIKFLLPWGIFFLFPPFWDIPFSLSLSTKRVSFKVTHLW